MLKIAQGKDAANTTAIQGEYSLRTAGAQMFLERSRHSVAPPYYTFTTGSWPEGLIFKRFESTHWGLTLLRRGANDDPATASTRTVTSGPIPERSLASPIAAAEKKIGGNCSSSIG